MRTGLNIVIRQQLALNCVEICKRLSIDIPAGRLEERQAQAEAQLEELRKRKCKNARQYYYTHLEECRTKSRKRSNSRYNALRNDADFRAKQRKTQCKYYLAHREELLAKSRERRNKQKQNIN